ncbi:hypothetical protein [Mesorhizobium sp.]|uniref:hypothetical protein n=1 Tax=Mesorhizobium sp. TaxID=1871066 RepID=UPI000FE78472|nr:hypothetical protein [Mesorhizobium sp.]RWF62472.1 MAG: hypothetical protein EOS47_23405 [Mesorhizobium sp.]TIT43063.1 MAG: hypothetical protein E5W76_08215 [Mesorhizobium sp.]
MRNGSKTDDGFVIVSFRRGTGSYKITPEQHEFIKRQLCREYYAAILTTVPLAGLVLLWFGGHVATHWLVLVAIIYVAGNTALSIARFRAIAHVKRFAARSSVPVEFPGMPEFKEVLLKAWRDSRADAAALRGQHAILMCQVFLAYGGLSLVLRQLGVEKLAGLPVLGSGLAANLVFVGAVSLLIARVFRKQDKTEE